MADDKPWKKRRDEDDEDDEDDDRPRRRRRDGEDGDDDFGGYGDDRSRRRLSRATLRGIAGYQRGVIICILIYLAVGIGQFAIPEPSRVYLLFITVPVVIAAAILGFELSRKVDPTETGVLLGVLALLPVIGLIALLIINGQATSVLRANGVRVGLLGARSSDI